MNKTSLFAGAVGGLLVAGVAFGSPYQGMSLELFHSGAQGDSYRLYANLDAGARIDAVYGNAQGTLEVSVDGGSMYHNANGGPTSKEINSNFFGFVPSMEWDSYVSIGALYQDGTPFGSNNLNNIGIDWAVWEGGGDLVTDNGSWFVTPDDAQGGEVNGQVFIGQFTIDAGTIVGQVNLQGKDADGNTWNEIGASWVPAPGALALLGLAGVAGRRRRRA
jgi:MYXO-CTERM domain-containing protein